MAFNTISKLLEWLEPYFISYLTPIKNPFELTGVEATTVSKGPERTRVALEPTVCKKGPEARWGRRPGLASPARLAPPEVFPVCNVGIKVPAC